MTSYTFCGTDENASEPAQTRRHRGLHRLGRAEVGEAGGEGARRDAMFDQGHHHGVEQPGFFFKRNSSGQFEERHVAEAQVAEDLSRQILAANHNALRRRPGQVGADGLHCSAFTPAAVMTLAHFAISLSRNCTASSPVLPTGMMPIWLKRSFMSDSLIAFTVSALNRLTISRGVPAGAMNSTQVEDSSGGPPASVMVGTSGAPWIRFAENIASALIFPPRTCGMSVLGTSTRTWISFAITAVRAGAVPL